MYYTAVTTSYAMNKRTSSCIEGVPFISTIPLNRLVKNTLEHVVRVVLSTV